MWTKLFVETEYQKAFDILYMVLTETALVIKILSIMKHSTIAKKLILSWSSNEEYEFETSQEQQEWAQAQKSFGKLSFVYISCSISVVFSAFTAELFRKEKTLAFPYYVPFDWSIPPYYWLAYFYGFFCMLLTCVSNITLDMIHCYFMLHVSLCFKLLGGRLEKLGINETPDATLSKLIKIIKLHQSVKRFVQKETILVC